MSISAMTSSILSSSNAKSSVSFAVVAGGVEWTGVGFGCGCSTTSRVEGGLTSRGGALEGGLCESEVQFDCCDELSARGGAEGEATGEENVGRGIGLGAGEKAFRGAGLLQELLLDCCDEGGISTCDDTGC